MAQTTFQNLSKLKTVQKAVKEALGSDYQETIQPFVDIIFMTMRGKKINEFEALKIIKKETEIYKTEHGPMCFSAAVIEITEAKNFADLKE
ncbi:hypothetical protein [Polaribacter atrinae]|uniref:hypothetical protein n=1 Tax=Polaribacter atrinae TaxID=1333662 RepID=UPI0030F57653